MRVSAVQDSAGERMQCRAVQESACIACRRVQSVQDSAEERMQCRTVQESEGSAVHGPSKNGVRF
jgi:hypothetical protein